MISLPTEIHRKFSRLPGAEHIASIFALEQLWGLIDQVQPRNVLELGAGIGTVTELLLLHPNIERVVSTEHTDFCLEALKRNLSNYLDSRLTIVKTSEELSAHRFKADLIVGDGSFKDGVETTFADEGTYLLVEGNRRKLRERFTFELEKRNLEVRLTHRKPLGLPRYRFHISRRFFMPLPALTRGKDGGCWVGQIVRK